MLQDSWIESGCVVCIVLEYGNLGDLKSRLEVRAKGGGEKWGAGCGRSLAVNAQWFVLL